MSVMTWLRSKLPTPSPAPAVAPVPALAPIAPFDACMAWIFAREGGFVVNAADPGGATNLGVTLATLAEWRGKPVTAADVRGLSQAEAAAIYRARYWDAVRGDDLPAGINLVVFDHAVTSGPSAAAKLLQQVVCVAVDGVIGPQTLAATRAAHPEVCVGSLSDMRAALYRQVVRLRPESAVFLNGWLNRTALTRTKALLMAAHG